ncbi:MAG TPA: LysM-like peptidoglycan-binding domain-containing protein, partial [Steroidobacteraceae bacterium]
MALRGALCVAAAGIGSALWLTTRHYSALSESGAPSRSAEIPRPEAAAASPAELPPPIPAQQASVAALVEVVVGRNDTLDAIFRRMQLNKADLAAIRNLPGIRQSLDFLKPGDAIKLTHTDGDIQQLTRKVSETQTLEVVRQTD